MARLKDLIALQIKTKISDKFELGTSLLNGEDLSSDAYISDPENYYWQDVTASILSISTKRGVDSRTGASAIPIIGPGVMHVRTTNHLLDPKYYSYLKPRQEVRLVEIVDVNHPVIFQGKIDTIDVDYRSDTDMPLISFNVVDPIGLLQQSRIKLISLGNSANRTWNHRVTEILTNANKLIEQNTYSKDKVEVEIFGGGVIKHGYWDDNYTALEALQLAQTTEGGFVYFDRQNIMKAYGKGTITAPGTTYQEFSNTDGTKFGYKNISIDYNSESVINEVQVSNQYGFNSVVWNEDADAGLGAFEEAPLVENKAKGPYQNEASIYRFGTRAMSASTNFHLGDGQEQIETWAQGLLDKNATPSTIVREIEWDGKKNTLKAAEAEILKKVHIHHTNKKLDPDVVIVNNYYQVIGIQHELQADDDTWRVKYILFETARFQ